MILFHQMGVDSVARGQTSQEFIERAQDLLFSFVDRLFGARGTVRLDRHAMRDVGIEKSRMHDRFSLEHIEAGTRDFAGTDSLDEGFFINDRTSSPETPGRKEWGRASSVQYRPHVDRRRDRLTCLRGTLRPSSLRMHRDR